MMLKILAVLGYILLAIIILIFWVIIIPRSVYVEYTEKDEWTVKLRIFLFKIRLYPPIKNPFKKTAVENLQDNQSKDSQGKDSQGKDSQEIPQNSYQNLENTADTPQQKISTQPKSAQNEQDSSDKNDTIPQKPDKKDKKDKPNFLEDMPLSFDVIKQILSAAKGVIKIFLRGIYIKDVSFNLPITGEDAHKVQKKYSDTTTAFYIFNIFLQRYVKIFYKKPIFIADFANLYSHSIYFYCKIQASPSIMLIVAWYLYKQYRKIIKDSKKGDTNYGRTTSDSRTVGVSVTKDA